MRKTDKRPKHCKFHANVVIDMERGINGVRKIGKRTIYCKFHRNVANVDMELLSANIHSLSMRDNHAAVSLVRQLADAPMTQLCLYARVSKDASIEKCLLHILLRKYPPHPPSRMKDRPSKKHI